MAMIVTIDGPAGSGKSTVARLLADRLQIRYLDTGAMYRAIALAVVQSQFDENDNDALTELATGLHNRIPQGQHLSQHCRCYARHSSRQRYCSRFNRGVES